MQKALQLLWMQDSAAEGEEEQGYKDKDNEWVQNDGKDMAITKYWEGGIEGLKDQVEQTKLYNDKAPEGEEMGNTGERITQHATLSKYDQEKFTDTVVDVIGAILGPGFDQ